MEKIVTVDNFDDIIASGVVLVDFWATWCGPCRALAPTVQSVAEEYEGKVVVAKCDVDECDTVAAKFNIRSIPTLIFFKDGQVAGKLVGNVPKSEITSVLNTLL